MGETRTGQYFVSNLLNLQKENMFRVGPEGQ